MIRTRTLSAGRRTGGLQSSSRQADFTISAAQQWCSRTASRCRPVSARPLGNCQVGFTIIELMIATVVFSTILVIITAGVLYFSNTYYASLNRSTTQNTARAIIKSVSEAVQFTGTVIATSDDTGDNYFCAGGKIYTFLPGVQYNGGQATSGNPGLYVAPQSSGCAPLTNFNNASGQQLLNPKMRITALSLRSIGNQMYTIQLTLAYGDDDLLTTTTGSDVVCKSQTGSQFCAVSSLNATIQRRLQDGQLSS